MWFSDEKKQLINEGRLDYRQFFKLEESRQEDLYHMGNLMVFEQPKWFDSEIERVRLSGNRIKAEVKDIEEETQVVLEKLK